MSLEICVLASGSAGNAIYLRTGESRLLLDGGLDPDELSARLRAIDVGLEEIDALVISHLHSDHLHPRMLRAWSAKRGRTNLWVHAGHAERLTGRAFGILSHNGSVRLYREGQPNAVTPDWMLEPIRLCHDAEPTFGFCLSTTQQHPTVATIISDTGRVPSAAQEAMARADVLALEFNHDPQMLAGSGRPASLIRRIRGPLGHLSNRTAATALGEATKSAPGGGPELVLLLHLSQECNHPALATDAANSALLRVGSRAAVAVTYQARPDKLRRVQPRPKPQVQLRLR